MADELKRALDTIMRPGFGALRPTAITPVEGADAMTPHHKAIEAMAKAIYIAVLTNRRSHHQHPEWENTSEAVREEYRRLARAGQSAGLASARASGWEMKPLDFPYEPLTNAPGYNKQQSRAVLIWRNMFGVAPRFEDAP
jgi:orotidine-5'-phosphate decarboxylase